MSRYDVTIRLVGQDALDVCLAIRRVVFIEGQGVPEEIEVDGLDGAALHFVAERQGMAIGTARLRLLHGEAKAERVAVLEGQRRGGVGRALMRALEREAARRGASLVLLHAQEESIPFYERLGYCVEGERFYEAGIPHRRMQRQVSG
jgi:predicted GNAT family N-acyltransferase